jgi:hypothetical protein
VEAQLFGDITGLIFLGRTALNTNNLLKRDNIGPHFAQDSHDAVRPHAPVHTATLVNVISNDP